MPRCNASPARALAKITASTILDALSCLRVVAAVAVRRWRSLRSVSI